MVKLIVGLIGREEFLAEAKSYLKKQFWHIDFESQTIDFNYTDYYKTEIGDNLKRSFLSFKKLVRQDSLARIKLTTHKIEKKLSRQEKRRVNIDPGYLTKSKLVLATHKDFSHRIYLERGIFAEVTLSFSGGSFRPWPWTYPDYQTEKYLDIFYKIREIYIGQIKKDK